MTNFARIATLSTSNPVSASVCSSILLMPSSVTSEEEALAHHTCHVSRGNAESRVTNMLISRSWGQQLPSVSSSWSVAPRRSWTSHSCGDTATSRATPATSSRRTRVRSTAAAVVYYLAALLLSCTCEGAGLCGWGGPEVGEDGGPCVLVQPRRQLHPHQRGRGQQRPHLG